MKIKVDWPSTAFAALILLVLLVFPFANPCETEDAAVCTWNSQTSGNGSGTSFTDFYGIGIYHVWNS